jgi:molybdopterin-guanine dinucleotide biosynthesis protein A
MTDAPVLAGGALGAVILCGGRSRRMGEPKAWLSIDGVPLLRRVVAAVEPVTSRIVVVGAAGQELPSLPEHVKIVRDAQPGEGPLSALAAGLAALQDVPFAFACATDAPFVHASVVRRLATLSLGHEAAVVEDGDFVLPLCAVYATSIIVKLEAMLASGQRRLVELVGAIDTHRVSRADLLADDVVRAADPELLSLVSVNTREELAAVLRGKTKDPASTK